MIENIVNNVGGYGSWQFIATSFSVISISYIILYRVDTIPFRILSIFSGLTGILLLWLYLSHEVQNIITKGDNISKLQIALLELMPLLFLVTAILIFINSAFRVKGDKK